MPEHDQAQRQQHNVLAVDEAFREKARIAIQQQHRRQPKRHLAGHPLDQAIQRIQRVQKNQVVVQIKGGVHRTLRLISQQVLDRPEQVQGRLPVIFFHRLANVLNVLREALIPCAPFPCKRLRIGLDVGVQNFLFPQRIVAERAPAHCQNRNQKHNQKQDCQHTFFMALPPLPQGGFPHAQSVLSFRHGPGKAIAQKKLLAAACQ